MFEDSLVESAGKIKTKGWTKILSLVIQVSLLGVMVLIPLIYTEALPKQAMTTFLVAPPPPPPPPPPPAATPVKVIKVQSDLDQGALRTPTKIPDKIKMIKEEEAPPQAAAGVVGGVAGGVPGGALGGVIGGIVGNAAANVPKVTAAKPVTARISGGVMAGNKIAGSNPQYPPIAKAARIQGAVVLAATISKNGSIENLRLISGPPMLVQAAMDAVKGWRYKPYLLSGEPTEVETTITVNFNLNGGTS
jgi:periplasmic protein TonB